jgi:hypothetical protein
MTNFTIKEMHKMKTIQISVPDNYLNTIKEFVNNIPNATFEETYDYELSNEQLDILDKRSKTPNHLYLSIEEANAKLKARYV